VTLAAARRWARRTAAWRTRGCCGRSSTATTNCARSPPTTSSAELDPVDVAIMDFAARIAVDQHAATEADAEKLRGLGLSDADIFQIVLAVGIRRFFSGVLDSVHAEPDPVLRDLGPPAARQ
jgi:hypothetical protein